MDINLGLRDTCGILCAMELHKDITSPTFLFPGETAVKTLEPPSNVPMLKESGKWQQVHFNLREIGNYTDLENNLSAAVFALGSAIRSVPGDTIVFHKGIQDTIMTGKFYDHEGVCLRLFTDLITHDNGDTFQRVWLDVIYRRY